MVVGSLRSPMATPIFGRPPVLGTWRSNASNRQPYCTSRSLAPSSAQSRTNWRKTVRTLTLFLSWTWWSGGTCQNLCEDFTFHSSHDGDPLFQHSTCFFFAFWRTVYFGVLKAQTKHDNTPSRVGQVGFGFGVLTHPPNNLGSISDSQQLFSITVGEDQHLQEPGRLWGAGDCWRKSAFPMVHPSNFPIER